MPVLDDIREVQRVTLKPGDVIVFKTRHSLSEAAVENIRAVAMTRFPDHEVVVLTADMDMRVVGEEDINDARQ